MVETEKKKEKREKIRMNIGDYEYLWHKKNKTKEEIEMLEEFDRNGEIVEGRWHP